MMRAAAREQGKATLDSRTPRARREGDPSIERLKWFLLRLPRLGELVMADDPRLVRGKRPAGAGKAA